MSETGEGSQSVSDNALRILLQKLDSISVTLKDTQMRVQILEEEKTKSTPHSNNNKEEPPWQLLAAGKDQDQVTENSLNSRSIPERDWSHTSQAVL